MSAPHGHGAPGHAIPKAPPMEPTTDSKTIERRALIHKLDDADAGARGRILSGTLSPEADATARKTILENRKKREDILDEEKKANEFVKNLIEKKKSLKTKIDNLHKNINEYKYRDGFKDALQHELDLAHNDLQEVQENIENNARNVQDYKLKENLDNTRKEYLSEYEKHAKNLKNKVAIKNVKIRINNLYQTTANIFRKEDNKKNLKGYKSVETYGDKNLREKKALYDDARVLLAQNMYERKEEELNASGIEASERIKKLKYYKATEIIQKVYVEEKAKTREAISSLERTKLDRLGLWYSKQPRWKKVALGTALFVGGGSAFATSMIAKYGIGWCIAGKFATSYGVGYITNTATGKVIDRIHKKGDKDFRNSINNDKLDLSSNFTRGDTDMTLLEYERQLSIIERREQEKLQKRMSAKMWAGLGLGIGAGALTYNLMADCTSPTTREIPMTKGEHFKAPAPVQMEKTLDEVVVKADKVETVPTPPAPISTGGDPVILKYPDLNIDQPEIKNMEGGLATTSDFTPHTTAEEFNPGNSNADQTPTVEKPKYNFGDYNPDERNLEQENPESGEKLDLSETPDPTGQENPESGERLDIPETKGNTEAPKIEESVSAENTNTESGLDNTAGQGSKINFEETQKIQENQLTELKNELGEKEYNKIIKDLESKNIPYKSDSTALRTIAIGESGDENFARTIARNYAGSQVLEQTGQTQATIGSGRILDSRMYELPNGEYRSVIIFETEKINGQDVDAFFKAEEAPNPAGQESPETNQEGQEMKIESAPEPINTIEETNTQPTINNSTELKKPDLERFNRNFSELEDKIKSGEKQDSMTSDKGTIENYRQLKKIMEPSDSNHEVVVIKATGPSPNIANLMLAREQVNYSDGTETLNKIIYHNQDGTYSIYKILEVKKSALIENTPVQENIQTNTPEIGSGDTSIESNSSNIEGNGQTAGEYTKSLIGQSESKAEDLRNLMGVSESDMKTMLTPSDADHTRIVIEKTSPDLATAQKMIDYDIRNIKAVSEDFKKVIDQKIYPSPTGYKIYEVIEIKK